MAMDALATEEELAVLSSIYEEYFSDNSDAEGALINPELLLSFELGDVNTGDLGMEQEKLLTPDVLTARIGFMRQQLPYQFNPLRHVSGLTAWDHPELFAANPQPDCLVKNQLYWHQAAGVHSIARNVFSTTPNPNHCTGTLISDEVGLGKTALASSFMAFLNQCILLQGRKQSLPPVLGEPFNSCVISSSHSHVPS
jgi:TATA-binding protein-associated factor